jgi:CRP-like cAMP-binding protein
VFRRLIRYFRDPEFKHKKEFLARLPLFRGVPNREVGIVFSALYHRTYEKGETLFLEGDIGRALFILESGSVELTKKGANGEPQLIATMGPGDYFGEMALLEQRPRLASAVAAERTAVYMLYKAKLDSLFSDAPRLSLAIMLHLAQLMSARLRSATERLVVGG